MFSSLTFKETVCKMYFSDDMDAYVVPFPLMVTLLSLMAANYSTTVNNTVHNEQRGLSALLFSTLPISKVVK